MDGEDEPEREVCCASYFITHPAFFDWQACWGVEGRTVLASAHRTFARRADAGPTKRAGDGEPAVRPG